MREFFIFLIIALLHFSCNSFSDTPNSNFRNETIGLKQGLGSISLAVPSRYDTILVWTNRSDCTTCGFEQIRFQRKIYPIFLESGFYWKGDPKDSVDEITIIQPRDMLPIDTTLMVTEREHLLFVSEYNKDPLYYPITRDTLMEINSSRYSIVYTNKFDSTSMVFQQTLIARGRLNGSDIGVKFRHWSRDSISSNFYQECLYVMNSLRFINGH